MILRCLLEPIISKNDETNTEHYQKYKDKYEANKNDLTTNF
jgi:hypothetical protein